MILTTPEARWGLIDLIERVSSLKKLIYNLSLGLLIGFVPFAILRSNDDTILAYLGVAILIFFLTVSLVRKKK